MSQACQGSFWDDDEMLQLIYIWVGDRIKDQLVYCTREKWISKKWQRRLKKIVLFGTSNKIGEKPGNGPTNKYGPLIIYLHIFRLVGSHKR